MQEFILESQWIIWLLVLWTVPWKGVALWKAARNGDKIWFVVILILNTLAILDILYIFVFGKKEQGSEGGENAGVNNGNPVFPPRRVV